MSSSLLLHEGARIAVLGGGPAGSFFALSALRLARTLGREFFITIYDRKDFVELGPQGCNMCAGAIGSGLVNQFKGLGLPLPPQVIRQEVVGYAFHGAGKTVYLKPGPEEKIYTVFRGGGPPGPRCFGEIESFDQHLLGYAESLGAKVIHQRVEGLEFPSQSQGRPVVRLKGEREAADLVVGAFGVNTALLRRFAPGYRPPATWHTCQAELEVDRQFVREKLKDMIHIFSTVGSGLHFLAITPKGGHLTVTGIGKHVKIKDLQQEMRTPQVREYLPWGWESICHCHPQVPVSDARTPYGDRWVIVGDASFCRYLKNGIESAFITSGLAAYTALEKGISSQDFYKHYYLPCRRLFARDNYVGKLLFFLHRVVSANDLLFTVCLDVAQREQRDSQEEARRLSTILWHMFSGNAPYRQILVKGLSPSLGWEFLRSSLSVAWQYAWGSH